MTRFRAAVAQVRATSQTADAVEKVAAVAQQAKAEGAEQVARAEDLSPDYATGYADPDDEITRGRYDFDAAGHYSRPDLFRLTVDTRVREPVEWLPRLEQQPPGAAVPGNHATDGVSRDVH